MASAEDIAAFRLVIDELSTTNYSDITLSDRMEAADSLNSLAADIWREKAGRYARLVDIQEGTSRRSLSQLHTHAVLMAGMYSGLTEDAAPGPGKRTTTRAIERP